MRNTIYAVVAFVVSIICLIAFSPFKKNGSEYALEVGIEINCPPSKAFEYLGNSEHASQWSAFVDHISPLNEDVIPDGSLGSIRRCFRKSNEDGMIWDEEIITYHSDSLRTLSIYNLQGFFISTTHLYTKQKYTPTSKGTHLIFGLYKKLDETKWLDVLKLKITGHYIKYIFNKNLRGIKSKIEHV